MFENWDHPKPEQIEVSIFGRGNGESILVHLGDRNWIVVDSLMSGEKSVPLIYFDHIGVKVDKEVKLVLASHWHDDHIKGLADVVDVAASASCSFPAAFLQDKFLKFASYFAPVPLSRATSGVKEMGRILEAMEARKWVPLQLGAAWATLLRMPAASFLHGSNVEVEAISPSQFDQLSFLAMVSQYVPTKRVAVRAPRYSENDVSCAVQIRIGADTIVLGADLEKTRDARSGWDAVFSAGKLTGSPASLMKVPHHGSVTGHHADIWNILCRSKPITSLTQWARGGHRLPKPTDVARIRQLSSESYSASTTITSGDRHRLQAVNSVLRRTNSKVRKLDLRLGHVRHRLVNGVWETELFGSAVELKNVAA